MAVTEWITSKDLNDPRIREMVLERLNAQCTARWATRSLRESQKCRQQRDLQITQWYLKGATAVELARQFNLAETTIIDVVARTCAIGRIVRPMRQKRAATVRSGGSSLGVWTWEEQEDRLLVNGSQRVELFCACGCGQPINEWVLPMLKLHSSGETLRAIAVRLGMSHGHLTVRRVMVNTGRGAKEVHGHHSRVVTKAKWRREIPVDIASWIEEQPEASRSELTDLIAEQRRDQTFGMNSHERRIPEWLLDQYDP